MEARDRDIECKNCGRASTGDHCQWCGYPLPIRGDSGKGKRSRLAMFLSLSITGGAFAYTYTTAGGSIGATADEDISTWQTSSGQPDWESLVPQSGGATEVLRPTAAGDATEIDTQYPAADAHWDKVDESTADDGDTYAIRRTYMI